MATPVASYQPGIPQAIQDKEYLTWTDSKTQELKTWCETQLSNTPRIAKDKWLEIAEKLECDPVDCKIKASSLQCLKKSIPKTWLPGQIEELQTWCQKQLEHSNLIAREMWQEIADKLGHTPEACRGKASELCFLKSQKKAAMAIPQKRKQEDSETSDSALPPPKHLAPSPEETTNQGKAAIANLVTVLRLKEWCEKQKNPLEKS